MKKWMMVGALLLGSVAVAPFLFGLSTATVEAAPGDETGTVLVTVDGIERYRYDIFVHGLEQGAVDPAWFPVWGSTSEATAACERYALMALDKPGRYRLTLMSNYGYGCRLEAVAP